MKNLRTRMIRVGKYLVFRKSRGAVTVEYALCMVVAAFLMLGVFVVFRDMSVQIIDEFKEYVFSFPGT